MYLAIPFISLYFHFFLNVFKDKLTKKQKTGRFFRCTYLLSFYIFAFWTTVLFSNIVVFFFKTGRELSPDLKAGGSEKFAAKDKNETNPEAKQVALIQSERFLTYSCNCKSVFFSISVSFVFKCKHINTVRNLHSSTASVFYFYCFQQVDWLIFVK